MLSITAHLNQPDTLFLTKLTIADIFSRTKPCALRRSLKLSNLT